jgi:hypothetical protein
MAIRAGVSLKIVDPSGAYAMRTTSIAKSSLRIAGQSRAQGLTIDTLASSKSAKLRVTRIRS